VTPFIASLVVQGAAVDAMSSVTFTIHTLSGRVSKPVSVTQSTAWLESHHFATAGASTFRLPIYGLYAGQTNTVDIVVQFLDGSTATATTPIATAAYTDPNGVLDHMTILHPRAAGQALGFDYFYLKTGYGSPAIVDTDGLLRWLMPNPLTSSFVSTFIGDGFLAGSGSIPQIVTMSLDGIAGHAMPLAPVGPIDFDHDFEPGRDGWIGGVDYKKDKEAAAVEVDLQRNVLRGGDFVQILTDYMTSQGDDPTLFVRPGVDWFHLNTAIYDPSDDTLIASSRENFVIKVGYDTGDVRWILGDPTKYWYTFASLRAKALTITGLAEAPIGQHALSFAPDGTLLLFNDGAASFNEPVGEPAGQTRDHAIVSDYKIDAIAGTAENVWNYDHQPELKSTLCSSARQVADGSMLVDYAVTNDGADTRILGIDPSGAVVFDFDWPNPRGCATAWYAVPIAMEALGIE